MTHDGMQGTERTTTHGPQPWLRRALCAALSVLAAALVPLGTIARAELASTEAALHEPAAAAARASLQTYLGRSDVRAELARLGVAPEDAQARVAALSDAEIVALDGHLRELPAGGTTFLAVVGGALLLGVTTLFITDLLGYTDVFPFINPIRK